MNAYKRTKAPKYRQLIEEVYQGGYEQYDKYNWDNKIEWFIYDDMMWWIISLARAYEITNDPKYLAHASSGFYHVWKESYDKERGACGGTSSTMERWLASTIRLRWAP